MGIIDYFIYAFPVTILELLAAIAGTWYLKKVPASSIWVRRFVYFLWFTLAIELLANYAVIAYFSDYKYFSFVKDTGFVRNFWLYNLSALVTFPFLALYFGSYLKNKLAKKVLNFLCILFLIFSVVLLIGSGGFFKTQPPIYIFGTLLALTSVIMFYFELLRSDYVLQLKRFLPFYLSLGTCVFYLCVTPLTIFAEYFQISTGNRLFVELRVQIILFSNIFMYSCFILGFIICSRKKKSS